MYLVYEDSSKKIWKTFKKGQVLYDIKRKKLVTFLHYRINQCDCVVELDREDKKKIYFVKSEVLAPISNGQRVLTKKRPKVLYYLKRIEKL